MSLELQTRFAAAQAAVREAGHLARRYFKVRDTLKTDEKGVQDLVSEADKAVETLLMKRFSQSFPDDGFLGEESGAHGDRENLWVIDPIDGTANFLRGLPYWSISIAYVSAGQVELGVIYDPIVGELFAAQRGAGASRDGEPIRASNCAEMAQCTFGLSFSRRMSIETYKTIIGRLLQSAGEYRRMGSAALMLAHVADGRLDGYYTAHLNSWDVLAGLLIAREAGAWTSDFLVDDGLKKGNAALACSPQIREELVSILDCGPLPGGTGPFR